MPLVRSVAAGTYTISKKRKAALEAFLGTCIGVTICDRVANVGGMIHLLLPEPTDSADPWQPEKYAATGLPMLIRDLLAVGAKMERMLACVAGGALVDPICSTDLNLDIGGRTYEVVRQILHDEGISIQAAEVGGFFSCRLTLDLQTWESRIEPTCPEAKSDEIPAQPLVPRDFLKAIDNTRPIPQVALKIIRMINDAECGLRDIARSVCTDQVLSAKVLSFCNSAFMGLRNRVKSIDQALILIGERNILKMIVSVALENFFCNNSRGYSLCRGGMYYHALGSARVAEALAKISGKASPGTAYSAGLLHDIGKVVLDQFMVPLFPYFYRQTHLNGVALRDVEREKFGIDHAKLGGDLADKWCLPEELKTSICRHHDLETEDDGSDCLVCIVCLADLIMSRFMAGQEMERIGGDGFLSRMRVLGIPPRDFPRIVEWIPVELNGGNLN